MTIALPSRIESTEFKARQARARQLADERELDGLIVWGRCGGAQDRYADLLYLTNFYSHFPFIADEPGRWRARGHAALVLPISGDSILIGDLPSYREDLAVADATVMTDDVVRELDSVMRATFADDQRIGTLGTDVISSSWTAALTMPTTPADAIGPELRLIKSEAELALIRAAGRVGSNAVDAAMNAAVPGATEAEAIAAGSAEIVAAGCTLVNIGVSSGPTAHLYSQSQTSPYDGRRRLVPGDMFRLDLSGSVDGYLFDIGRSRVVGAEPNATQRDIIDGARDAVLAGIDTVRPGVSFGDVARACDDAFARSSVARGLPELGTAFGAWGHSLGLAWEMPWIERGSEVVLEPGINIAIERRVALPGLGGATHEENVIVTSDGPEVTSAAAQSYE